jgi:phage baseplate assembly protein W
MEPINGPHLAFPFRIGDDGRSAVARSEADHVRDELLQLMLTDPGERPFLPDFGGGARRLVFEPASDVLREVTKARITQALSRWLGHRLTVEELLVTFEGALIEISVSYRPVGEPDSRVVKFQRRE